MLSHTECKIIAKELHMLMQSEQNMPAVITCEWARDILGSAGKPITQETLKRKLDKIGKKAFYTGREKSILSEWITALRYA